MQTNSIYQIGQDGSFQLLTPTAPGLQDFLNGTHVETNMAWRDLLEAADFVTEQTSGHIISKIQSVRAIRSGTDDYTIRQTCRLLGFDLNSDVYSLNTSGMLKLATQLNRFSDYSSTPQFNKFMDMVLNAVSSVEYLWTNDYKSFFPVPKGISVDQGGDWYLTTHCNLSIELKTDAATVAQVLKLAQGTSIASKMRDVFYEFAPITLVLDSVILCHPMPCSFTLKAQMLNYRHEVRKINSRPWLGLVANEVGAQGSVMVTGSALDTVMPIVETGLGGALLSSSAVDIKEP